MRTDTVDPTRNVQLDPPDLYRAYERILPDYREREQALNAAFDELLVLAKEIESPLLREMKPTIVIALKWKFDYLAKIYASPFEMEADVLAQSVDGPIAAIRFLLERFAGDRFDIAAQLPIDGADRVRRSLSDQACGFVNGGVMNIVR